MCTRQTTKKYLERPSPSFPAQECAGMRKKGNNGKMWDSVANRNGIYQWKPVEGKASKRSSRKRSSSKQSKRSSRSSRKRSSKRSSRSSRKRSSKRSSRSSRPKSSLKNLGHIKKITMKIAGKEHRGGVGCWIDTTYGYVYILRPKSRMYAVLRNGAKLKFSLNDKKRTFTTGSTVITFDRPIDYRRVVNDLGDFATKHIKE